MEATGWYVKEIGRVSGCSETSAYKIQTPGNYPEESIQKTKLYFITQNCLKLAWTNRTADTPNERHSSAYNSTMRNKRITSVLYPSII